VKYEKSFGGSETSWPVWFKVGLFRANKNDKFGFSIRFKPLFLIYLFVPGRFKFWLSIEKRVKSLWYNTFIDCGIKRTIK